MGLGGGGGGGAAGPCGGVFKVSAHMQPDNVMHVMTTHSINHEQPEADILKVCICGGEEVNFCNGNLEILITTANFANINCFVFSAYFSACLVLAIGPICLQILIYL